MKTLLNRFVAGFLLIGILGACAPLSDVKTPTTAAIPMKSYTEPYTAGPLDQLTLTKKTGEIINLALTTDLKLEYPQGSFINVAGESPEQIEKRLKESDPSIVSISYQEFRANKVAITGEVNIQTHLDLQDAPLRVLDAIAAAGGFTPLANMRRVRLLRQNAGSVQVYELNMQDVIHGRNMQENLIVQPGDSLYIPRTFL